MRTSFHHRPEAQHPISSAIHKLAGRLPHLSGGKPDIEPTSPNGRVWTQTGHVPDLVWRLAIRRQRSRPRCPGMHPRHRGAAADPGPLIWRALLDIGAVKSSILERNVLRIGDLFALL
jgi:hypothetical protein